MCTRYALTSPVEAVRSYFRADGVESYPARYNIAPTQPVLIVRQAQTGGRELALVRWGLIPSWVKDPRACSTLVNARSETAADKPSFRGPLRHRRCLVPTNGYYEWTGRPGSKQPHLIRPRSDEGGHLMAMAGIWEHWLGADGSEMQTMALLTTAANTATASIHDRMPVIVNPVDFALWLDCAPGSAVPIQHMLHPASDDVLEILSVSPRLNNYRNEGPDLWRVRDDVTGAKLI
ncbi:MAG: SOS response-associated peptidase [Hyphomicrobiaceae bacterium]